VLTNIEGSSKIKLKDHNILLAAPWPKLTVAYLLLCL